MEKTVDTIPSIAQNPLSKYFRQPAIYMKLPSNGQFWTEGSIDLPVTGEIPIYPMTARDEVTLRTPDALLNGTSMVEIIQSCCPSIKNAWIMPSIDVDAVLIGIRIASYGHEMDIDSKCPHCDEENNHCIDLRVILSNLKCPDFDTKIEVSNLKIKLKPQAFFNINKTNSVAFEEQRLLEAVNKTDLTTEVRTKQINESMKKLLEISINTICESTESIEIDDGTVVNSPAYIKDFFNNADGVIIRSIQRQLGVINVAASIKDQLVTCSNLSCAKEFTVPLEFDYANFFAQGS